MTIQNEFSRKTRWYSYYEGEGDNPEDVETEQYTSDIEIDIEGGSWVIDERMQDE